jgi:hypothetical protein
MVSAKTHYAAIAFWQPIPLWHYIVHVILSTLGRTFIGSLDGSNQGAAGSSAYLSRVKGVYDLVFIGGAIGQLPILLLSLVPKEFLSTVAESLPWLRPYTASSVTLSSVFAPWSPLHPPTVDAETLSVGDLSPLAVYFLHWDMYIGCGALLLWALFLHRVAIKTVGLWKLLAKAAVWFSIGGFASAVAALLWERDQYVLEDGEGREKKDA